MRTSASILHLDMDAFFVSVEVRDRPGLARLPVVVAGNSPRSVVASASYASRRFGVRSAMPLQAAKQRCPGLIVVEPNFEKYRQASHEIMEILQTFTPLVEQLSIDEAFLDVDGARRLFGTPEQVAQQIRDRVRTETGLPSSVGGSGVKFVSKLASAHAKPEGVLIVEPDETLDFLRPLAVQELWGVGGVSAEKLRSRGIRTIGELAREPVETLSVILGEANATRLHSLANGIDTRTVEVQREVKSIGHEETFSVDISDPETLKERMLSLSLRTAEKLRFQHLLARTISVKLRRPNFETISRSRTLPEPTQSARTIHSVAVELMEAATDSKTPIRLIGVRAEQLLDESLEPLGLWSEDEAWRTVESTMDDTRRRFGAAGLAPAKLVRRKPEAEAD